MNREFLLLLFIIIHRVFLNAENLKQYNIDLLLFVDVSFLYVTICELFFFFTVTKCLYGFAAFIWKFIIIIINER